MLLVVLWAFPGLSNPNPSSLDLTWDGRRAYQPGPLEGLSWSVLGVPQRYRGAFFPTLVVHVTDEAGAAVPGATVSAVASGGEREAGRTGAQGAVTLELPSMFSSGQGSLEISAEGFTPAVQQVWWPRFEATVVLKR